MGMGIFRPSPSSDQFCHAGILADEHFETCLPLVFGSCLMQLAALPSYIIYL
jgi:hypothetical protein